MEIYLNQAGELTCSKPCPKSTVADLIDAVLRFCRQHIDCSGCSNTCCAGLTVYVDNVFIKNLSNTALRAMAEHESIDLISRVLKRDSTMKWTLLKNTDRKCKFLSRIGKCLIYEARPLVCRLHTCLKCEPDFQKMKSSLYYAYQEAAKVEMQQLLSMKETSSTAYCCTNPLVGMNSYEAIIADVVEWSQAMQRRCTGDS